MLLLRKGGELVLNLIVINRHKTSMFLNGKPLQNNQRS